MTTPAPVMTPTFRGTANYTKVAAFFPAKAVSPSLGIPPPDMSTGYADSPLVASWKAKSARGEPVTIEERNAFIASLAWCADQLAVPPVQGSTATRFVMADGTLTTALGSREFQGGADLAIPTVRPVGTTATPGATIDYTVFSTADRFRMWQQVRATIAQFSYERTTMGAVATAPGGCPAGDPTVYAPSCPASLQGDVNAAGDPITIGVIAAVAVVVVGIAAYASYRATTTNARIHEDGATARIAAQVEGQARQYAQGLQYARETGRAPPPINPIVPDAPAQHAVDSWIDKLTDGATKIAVIGLVVAVGVAVAPIVWEWAVDSARKSVKHEPTEA